MAGRKTAPLQLAEQELKSFSYIVCHDLAASLRHLTQFSRLLAREHGEEKTERGRVLEQHLREASVQCEAMLEQLSAYSRIQQKPLERVTQDAGPIVRMSLLRVADRVRSAGAEIVVEPLGEVHADADLITQAVVALIDNAIKFARPDVPLRIAIGPAHDKSAWRLRIQDNGLGLEPTYREAAFQMFRRLHRQASHPGVGAGLTIARRIARLHKGDAAFLDCEEGACIELAIPHARRPTKDIPKERAYGAA